jgi:GTP-binding protein YchF
MLRLGIVGLPNVGKSTLFNALTSAKALVANYPFATIEPNTGIVQVPDARLEVLAGIVSPERTVPATVEFVDIAGLVKGASEGEGLGNQFLANIREVDAILHVVRCFEDADVQHVMGPVDPVRDREVINIELGLADLASVEKRLDKAARTAKSGDAQARLEQRLLESVRDALAAGQPARVVSPGEADAPAYRGFNLLTAKPVLYAANVGEHEIAAGNAHVDALRSALARDGEVAEIVPFSAKVEAELAELGPTFSRPWAWPSRGSIGWPTRPTRCSACRATSRPVRWRSEHGPSIGATRPRRPRASSIRISRKASFARRRSLTTTSSASVAGSSRASRACPAPKARSTWSGTAT